MRVGVQSVLAEFPVFFESEGRRMFGVVHQPGEGPMRPAMVFCAALGEEKLWAHRVFVNLARDLAKHGFPVFRFDYWGEGDSDGDFEDATLATRVADAGAAAAFLHERFPNAPSLGWLGLRLGGTIAALAAERARSNAPLVLAEPVIVGHDYVQELLRINLATQTAVYKEIRRDRKVLVEAMRKGVTVNVDGFELSERFHDELTEVDLRREPRPYDAPVLILSITRVGGPPAPLLVDLASRYRSARVESIREELFWKELRTYSARADRMSEAVRTFLDEAGRGDSSR